MKKTSTYKSAGVDLAAADQVVGNMKKIVEKTFKNHPVVSTFGGFSGVYKNSASDYLLATCDGVGTKLLVAQQLNNHRTIGIDLVAMSANDLLAQGGRPLFFLDYLAIGKIEENIINDLISGIAEGCQEANCALLGGETAEMPDLYQQGVYDLAGFMVGVASKEELLPRNNVQAGDLLLALPSSGLHSNGYSLARKILLQDNKLDLNQKYAKLENTLGEELLKPTRIYLKEVLALKQNFNLKAMANITGGGLAGNLKRVLPLELDYKVEINDLKCPQIFSLLQKLGNVEQEEMYRTFNMGLGMIGIFSQQEAIKARDFLNNKFFKSQEFQAEIIGEIVVKK